MAFTPTYRAQNVEFDGNKTTSKSMAASFNSDKMYTGLQMAVGLQAIYTGSPVGCLFIQYSFDGTNWSDVAGTNVGVNGADNTIWILPEAITIYFRLSYEFTSGTGTLTGLVTVKE